MKNRAHAPSSTFRITPRGPYSLDASAKFLCGFTPAAGGSTTLDDGRLVLGLLDEARHVPIAVALSQAAKDGVVVAEIAGSPSDDESAARIERQVARILSLDHDARGLAALGARDAVVRRLLEASPGFRPVCFPSPYEAAVWGVLAQRIAMPVAAAIKQRLAVATDTVARGFGRTFHCAPAPERLLTLESFPGVAAEKMTRLHGVALAALEGKLDADRLRALPMADAVEELRAIRGVGPWTAEHILLRGCGVVDEVPTSEPRFLRGLAEAYGLDATPTADEARVIAERWRPYRMWVAVLVVMSLRRSAAANARPQGQAFARL
ncbi:MAG: HhH-GPD family protein [Myxococcaceae bacterium]|nr:HhH-GPD family protein [Myxococcaceae bacterium]